MNLPDYFEKCTQQAKLLLYMHDSLDFRDKRVRSEWREKLFENKLVDWGKQRGVWRSVSKDKKIQILGSDSEKSFHKNLSELRPILLQHALVMTLAAIDKTLHHATTTKNFATLLKNGELDEFVKNFPVSETYSIAMESTKRRGNGGKIKIRPAHKIRDAVSRKLYAMSFLGTREIENICAANGVKKIFTEYATHLGRKGVQPLKDQWTNIYQIRNAIVHECSVERTKISPKKIRLRTFDIQELKKDIDFAEKFGIFIAQKIS